MRGTKATWQEPDLFGGGGGPPQKVRKKRQTKVDAVQQAREFGKWTLDKLAVLETYLKMYRRVAGSGSTYIDAFAAEGTITVDGVERPGSALIALESTAFRQLLLIEMNPAKVTRLTDCLSGHRHADRCDIRCGDTNDILKQVVADGVIDRSKPCFAFLDPDSTQLDWSTVEALAGYKPYDEATGECKIELWILFNLEQAIQRLWPVDKSTLPQHAAVLDRIMGGRDAWIDLWEQNQKPVSLVWRYRDRLAELGYKYVKLQQVLDPNSHRRHYWMIHATDHQGAESLMRWAKKASTSVVKTESFPGMELK